MVDVQVGAAVVGGAVEHAERVAHQPADGVAAQLDADVALGREVRVEGALAEHQVAVGLQPLEADRRLELSGPQLQPGAADVDVRVEERGAAVAEVGHQPGIGDAQPARVRIGRARRTTQVSLS